MVGDEWQARQGTTENRLMEEAVEIAQAALTLAHMVSKSIRFGMENRQPGLHQTNRERLVDEMADLVRIWNDLAIRERLPSYTKVDPDDSAVPCTLRRIGQPSKTTPPKSWAMMWPGHEAEFPVISCDRGHLTPVKRNEVKPDGTFNQSVRCIVGYCNWHAWVTLEEWGK